MRFGFRRRAADTRGVKCPHCGRSQEVEQDTLSAFCKRCHTRFEVNGPRASFAEGVPAPTQKRRQRTQSVTCERCGRTNEVPIEAVSAFCKGCGVVMSLQRKPTDVARFGGLCVAEREVSCYCCGAACRVPKSAISALCPRCGGHISFEDIEVLHADHDIVTRGRLYVKPGGRVRGSVDAAEARVDGEILGAVTVERNLCLGPTGRVYGPVVAKALEMAPGAVLVGSLRLNAGGLPSAKATASGVGERASAGSVRS